MTGKRDWIGKARIFKIDNLQAWLRLKQNSKTGVFGVSNWSASDVSNRIRNPDRESQVIFCHNCQIVTSYGRIIASTVNH